jgi:hypothetical protein
VPLESSATCQPAVLWPGASRTVAITIRRPIAEDAIENLDEAPAPDFRREELNWPNWPPRKIHRALRHFLVHDSIPVHWLAQRQSARAWPKLRVHSEPSLPTIASAIHQQPHRRIPGP